MIYLFLLISLLITPVYGDDDIKSIKQDRKDTIQFGIDDQVISLITDLKKEKEEEYNADLLKLLDQSSNTKLNNAILDLFKEQETDIAAEWALNALKTEAFDDQASILASLSYLRIIKYKDLRSVVDDYLEDEDRVISLEAIRDLGAVGDADDAKHLLDLLDDDDIDDSVRPEILRSLGRIHNIDTLERIIKIADSDEEDKDMRLAAIWALGEIETSESHNVLISIMTDQDPFIRTEALGALIKHKNEDLSELFIKSLRDSYWKIRIEALKGIGEKKYTEALDNVIYMARKDPVEKVQLQAMDTVGQFESGKGKSYLKELFENKDTKPKLRQKAFLVLLEHDKGSLKSSIEKVMKEEWDEDKSWILDVIGKNIATTKYSGFSSLYEKFLTHKNYIIQIYGLRGIENNNLTGMKNKIIPLAGEKQNGFLRKYAYSVLEEMGMSKDAVDKANESETKKNEPDA
ncbi:HEAT repeat domain-containing protein [Spirochaeta cellobiosiphila]|uniref:HEAT repeat domain-containing protein n=1 Tax=Spirochaeta cellobiosiphila TaxID=504483 RepID=UPI00041C808F|nr:HEAT repeat domain-containing protein [Spirochaeta cellobiosiphila]